MDWYYVDAGRRVGPVAQEQFDALVAGGTVTLSTLVWHEDMPDWQTWSVVQSAPAGAPAEAAPVASAAPVAGGEQRCSQCGLVHSQNDMIQYQGFWVCATCKPVFLQRLREGAAGAAGILGMVTYAGFWIRVVAVIIDSLALGVAMAVLMFAFGAIFYALAEATESSVVFILMQGVMMIVQYGSIVAYDTFFHGKFGATPGKMACGLKVVLSDGSKITYLRAFARAWAWLLNGFTCYIGFIIAGFDSEKRALHDHICSTRVIKTR